MSKTTNLFDEEMAAPVGRKAVSRKTAFEDYEGFVEKFKPKKTTDDCYTPEPVYEAIKGGVSANLMPLDKARRLGKENGIVTLAVEVSGEFAARYLGGGLHED